MAKVVALVGSLRARSFNRALFQVAQEVVPAGMTLEEVSIADLPLYNGDLEADPPEAVQSFWARLEAAEAFLFVTPEYNYSIPGVLKNALDWGSRCPKPLYAGKTAALMGASMGVLGTARCQYHLRQVCVNFNLHVVNRPEVMVASAQNKFDADLKLTDDGTRQHVAKLLVALHELSSRFAPG